MAITKRFKTKFECKLIFSDEELIKFKRKLLDNSKTFLAGAKLSGVELKEIQVAAQEGIEAAIEFSTKSAISKWLKDELRHEAVVSNVSTQVLR